MTLMKRTSPLRIPMTLGALVVLAATAPVAQDKGQEPKKDAKTEKIDKAELGKPAPAFELKNIEGKTVKLSDYKGKTVVLEWFNPTCPYCVYAYGAEGPLRTMPEDLKAKGVVWLSIVSENPKNPGGQADTIKKFMEEHKMKALMLVDPDGKVGRLYGAKSTPHMFVISEKGALVYRGALDNAPHGELAKEDTRVNYVQAAVADLSSGHAVTKAETKSYG
jgi:peroxiredoxin